MALPPANARVQPRLTATQLADYVAATTTLSQMAILRQAKFPGDAKPLIIQYQIIRKALASALTTPGGDARILGQVQHTLEQRRDDPSSRPLVVDDARRSLAVLEAFNQHRNQFDFGGARFEATDKPPSLVINGVEISVVPDAICISASKQGARVGQLFIRCAAGDKGEAAQGRRVESNAHLCTIAHMSTVANLSDKGTPYGPASMVIDVQRGKLYKGSSNTITRVRNIEASCAMIEAVWPKITQ